MKLRSYVRAIGQGFEHGYEFWCPGCYDIHRLRIKAAPNADKDNQQVWEFDGDLDRPTFSPDLHYFHRAGKWVDVGKSSPSWQRIGEKITECRLYISEGYLQYTNSCPHALKGLTIPMVDVPKISTILRGLRKAQVLESIALLEERRRLSSTLPRISEDE